METEEATPPRRAAAVLHALQHASPLRSPAAALEAARTGPLPPPAPSPPPPPRRASPFVGQCAVFVLCLCLYAELRSARREQSEWERRSGACVALLDEWQLELLRQAAPPFTPPFTPPASPPPTPAAAGEGDASASEGAADAADSPAPAFASALLGAVMMAAGLVGRLGPQG
ncbi:hypothetical protein AB1Y20_010959 [Prymnesium parvum]|uniref:Uncharacterized protein n=1 Tax=Prymnesium parvum TaxID=97485 RepID=A0AB34ISV4_PRYPA